GIVAALAFQNQQRPRMLTKILGNRPALHRRPPLGHQPDARRKGARHPQEGEEQVRHVISLQRLHGALFTVFAHRRQK
ncbi:MAG: hypothetical protein RLZZ519_3184, partial [Bacteroidota bacterium]